MSLTEAERVFTGITEQGINDLLQAFFDARPRYLDFGSPGFVAFTTASETQMPAIAFPGVPGGIDWSVQLAVPRVDLHPQTDALPPELSLGAGQVSLSTSVRLCVACETAREREPQEDRLDRDTERRSDDDADRDTDRQRDKPRGEAKGTCFELQLFALGHLQRVLGPDSVVIVVDAVEIVDIDPTELEAVLECLLLHILRAILANVRLPLETLRAGGFSLTLIRGPYVETDQLRVFGNL
jgi:hypothetical protein